MEIQQNPTENNNKKTENNHLMVALLGVLVGIVIAVFGFVFWKIYAEKQNDFQALKNQVEDLKKEVGDSTDKGIVEEDASGENISEGEEYAGWKTYYNYEVGYMLRYPSDWIIKETDEWNDLTDQAVKYVSIDTPDKKFFLYFGMKGKSDDFGISNRTGVGAGELKDVGNITILETNATIKNLVYGGKIQEIFFGALGSVNTKDGKYSFSSSLSPHDKSTGNFPDLDSAEKILQSIKIVERKKISCISALSSEDNLDMKDWKVYKNNKYHYSFKYPKDWTNPDVSNDVVTLNGDGGDTTFQFRSGASTATDYMGYEIDSKENVQVSCQNGKSTYLSGDTINNPGSENDRMIFTQFDKNGIKHLVMFSYQYVNASISSNMTEMYDSILKSVTFE